MTKPVICIFGLFFISLIGWASAQPVKPADPAYSWVSGKWEGVSGGGNLSLDADLRVVNGNELRGEFEIYHRRSGGQENATITSGSVRKDGDVDFVEFTITYYPGKERYYKLIREDKDHLVGMVTRPEGNSYSMIFRRAK